MSLDVGDVGHPDLVGLENVELLLQLVIRHDGWPATIPARTTLITNLRGDPGQGCETRNSVLRYLFSLVAQIVRQLAIAIHLSAVRPGLSDQRGLVDAFQRTVT